METQLANYAVGPTSDEFKSLEPVRFSIGKGAFHFQDYLTVEQAVRLASMLTTAALEIERAQEGVVETTLPDENPFR